MLLDLKYFLFQNLKNNNVKFNDKKKKKHFCFPAKSI